MIVVDTNVIAYLFIRGPFSDEAERLLDFDAHWVAPEIWLPEFTNVLLINERHGGLEPEESEAHLRAATELMGNVTFEIEASDALATARKTGCTVYDSHFVTLAKQLSLRLYTFDKKILATCPDIARRPE